MSKYKHSKGDWEVSKTIDNAIVSKADRGTNLLGTDEEGYAIVISDYDAKLMASAPAMLDELIEAKITICRLCKRLNPQHKDCGDCPEMEGGIHKVLEEATGLTMEEILDGSYE